ncbi:MAG TPA: ABC transporter permease [Lacunisphaera sp.]|nr:ABC transporter permease [Lacunisphaera sp.]
MIQDLRHALTSLWKSPGFTLVAVFTLALGLGANTAIFSYVHAILLRPLPFPTQDRLVAVYGAVQRDGWERRAFSLADFRDYRAHATTHFAELAAYSDTSVTLTGGNGAAERLYAEMVNAGYFPALGVPPLRGRVFRSDEDAVPGAAPVALISEGLWRRRYGGDPAVVGQKIQLNETNFLVVGVMPDGFRGISDHAEVWMPMAMVDPMVAPEAWSRRGWRWHEAIGLLKPGATILQAQAELDTIAASIAKANPEDSNQYGARVIDLREELVGDLRQPVLTVLVAVGCVLLITCVNVANLMLVRLNGRRAELGIRASLGAGRTHLARLFLAEAALIGLFGGALALLMALWGIDVLRQITDVPQYIDPRLSWPVFLFAAALAAISGLAVGLFPAWEAGRRDLLTVLKDGGRGAAGAVAGKRTRSGLLIAEITLALALLIGSGLVARSYYNLVQLDPGYRPTGLLTGTFELPAARYDADRARVFRQQLQEKLAALPGVRSAALATNTPLDGNSSSTFGVADRPAADPADNEFRLYTHAVSSGYFTTLGTPFVAGGDFDPAMSANAEGEPVVIVSENVAKKFWPKSGAVGERIKAGRGNRATWMRIIGVVAETKSRRLPENSTRDPDVYLPLVRHTGLLTSVAIHADGEAAALQPAVRQVLAALDPNIPLYHVATIEDRIRQRTAGPRLITQLTGFFSGVALILACLGIYGVVSFNVGLRTQEIGVRMALGARPVDILNLVLGGTGQVVLAGLGLGLALAFALSRLMASLLYNVPATDPLVYGGGAVVLALAALLAAWVPARRAARVNPVEALRAE